MTTFLITEISIVRIEKLCCSSPVRQEHSPYRPRTLMHTQTMTTGPEEETLLLIASKYAAAELQTLPSMKSLILEP